VETRDFRQSGMVGTATSAADNPSGPVANKNIIASCTLTRNNNAFNIIQRGLPLC